MTDFRLCSNRRSRSQAGLYHCTQQLVSDQLEPTIARLRYSLGGDRPSQTSRLALSRDRMTAAVRKLDRQGWYFTNGSAQADAHASLPPTYPTHPCPSLHAKLK